MGGDGGWRQTTEKAARVRTAGGPSLDHPVVQRTQSKRVRSGSRLRPINGVGYPAQRPPEKADPGGQVAR